MQIPDQDLEQISITVNSRYLGATTALSLRITKFSIRDDLKLDCSSTFGVLFAHMPLPVMDFADWFLVDMARSVEPGHCRVCHHCLTRLATTACSPEQSVVHVPLVGILFSGQPFWLRSRDRSYPARLEFRVVHPQDTQCTQSCWRAHWPLGCGCRCASASGHGPTPRRFFSPW